MAIIVNLAPSIVNYIKSNQTLSATLGGSGYVAPYDKPYWESNAGYFSAYNVANPTFYPYHRTEYDAYIGGRRVARIYNSSQNNISNLINATLSDSLDGTINKLGGADGTWDAKGTSSLYSADLNCLLSFRGGQTNKAKAGGLTDNATEINPTATDSGFRFAWVLWDDATAVPYHRGTALAEAIPYTTSTEFKLKKVGATMYYYADNVLIAEVAVGGAFNYYPNFTFRDNLASVTTMYFQDTDGINYVDEVHFVLYAVFPEQPNWSYTEGKDVRTLASEAEDGSVVFREKGTVKTNLTLRFVERPFSEYEVIKNFWLHHRKYLPFYYHDIVTNEQYRMVFNSSFQSEAVGADRFSISLGVQEL